MSCNKCKVLIKKNEVNVKCSDCTQEFHVSCCPQTSVDSFNKLSKKRNGLNMRKCDQCEAPGDNASVSSRSDSEQEPVAVVEMFKNIQRQLKANQEESRSGFSNIREDIKKIDDSIKIIHTRVSDVEGKVTGLSERVSELESVNNQLVKRIKDLEVTSVRLDQYSRKWNLEIRGIPSTPNEDVYEVLRSVARALGVTFDGNLISIAHRLPSNPGMRYPPIIIVQFISRVVRGEWLYASRQKRLQTTDLNSGLKPGPVFICDQLTPH